MERSIINQALPLLMKHVVIGQLNEYHFSLLFIGQSATHLSDITVYNITVTETQCGPCIAGFILGPNCEALIYP